MRSDLHTTIYAVSEAEAEKAGHAACFRYFGDLDFIMELASEEVFDRAGASIGYEIRVDARRREPGEWP